MNVVEEPRRPSVWHMEDSLVLLKRSIAEAVIEWNVRLSDAEAAYIARKREEKNKKTAQDAKSSLSTSAGLSDIIDGASSDFKIKIFNNIPHKICYNN